MGTLQRNIYNITLEDPQMGGFFLFSDGFFSPPTDHPDAFAFHRTTSLETELPIQSNAQVDIGPDLYNSTLEAVSPGYMVILWDDVS
jgi:hypothetical protein